MFTLIRFDIQMHVARDMDQFANLRMLEFKRGTKTLISNRH